MGKSIHNNVIALCSKRRTVVWVQGASFWHKTSSSMASMSSPVLVVRSLPLPYFLSPEPIVSISPQQSDQYWTRSLLARKLLLNSVTFILSENFYHNFVLISKNHLYCSRHQKRKHYVITVASWLTKYCHTWNFSFPVLILKYLNLKNDLANFVQNCKIYSKD